MNPYQQLPPSAFWKTAVANKNLFDIAELWQPKFHLTPQHQVATFGSCFAQHIGNALQKRGFSWLSTEPAPTGLSATHAKDFNYNVFTCRTGNIYTASLLKQWCEWALTHKKPPEEYWKVHRRVFDPFRPNIEPNGFASHSEMQLSRQHTIAMFAQAIKKADVFVFTLGLTESWFNKAHGYEYPMCPGTVAGEFDAEQHVFCNQSFADIHASLNTALALMLGANPKLRIILTVSPVPLTATKSGQHILLATMYSKSVLRAVAGQCANDLAQVDYFPSYEIINSPPFKGIFFEPNQRSVNHQGVDWVMTLFFQDLARTFGIDTPNSASPISSTPAPLAVSHDDVVCEEQLLAAFGQGGAV